MKLYKMTDDFNAIFDLLESEDTELDYQVLEDTLQAIEGNIEVKVGGVAKMILSLQKMAEAYGSEAKRLADKARATDNKIKWFKNYLLQAMEATAKDKILTDVGTVARQKSSASVQVMTEADIPKEYWYMPIPAPQLDKRALLDELKRGTNIPGVQLHQGYHIRIR